MKNLNLKDKSKQDLDIVLASGYTVKKTNQKYRFKLKDFDGDRNKDRDITATVHNETQGNEEIEWHNLPLAIGLAMDMFKKYD